MEIVVHNISYAYAEKIIFEDAHFVLKAGKIYGLIGENGSGKTTLISLLSRIQPLQSGEITNVIQPGLLLQGVGFYQELSAYENLQLFACEKALPLSQVKEVLNVTGFSASLHGQKYKQLSQGYKQRLSIARSFLTEGNLVLLDEPFSAVDLPTIRVLKQAIKRYVKETERTILISSHQLKEISDLLDEILLLKDRQIFSYTYAEQENREGRYIYLTLSGDDRAEKLLAENLILRTHRRIDQTMEVELRANYGVEDMLTWLDQQGIGWTKIEKQVPLEFLFY
ncbi:MAG: ABC transporter ATP-binding protein [Bacteroidota bacterium]